MSQRHVDPLCTMIMATEPPPVKRFHGSAEEQNYHVPGCRERAYSKTRVCSEKTQYKPADWQARQRHETFISGCP